MVATGGAYEKERKIRDPRFLEEAAGEPIRTADAGSEAATRRSGRAAQSDRQAALHIVEVGTPRIVTRLVARSMAVAAIALIWPAVLSAQRSFAITHVSVIDGTDSVPRRDQTVVVRGTRIVSVTAARSAHVPVGRARRGRPRQVPHSRPVGHARPHGDRRGTRAPRALRRQRRDRRARHGGDWATITAWRTDIAHGRLDGPRIIASGPYLEGGDVPVPHILTRTPTEGRAGVDSLVALGVDFVKVHGQLTPETYFAIARARANAGSRSPATCRARSERRPRPIPDSGASSTCWRSPRPARRPSRSRSRRAFRCRAPSDVARRRISRRSTLVSFATARGSPPRSRRSTRSPSGPRTRCRVTRSRTISRTRCGASSRKSFRCPTAFRREPTPLGARCSRSVSRRSRRCIAPACTSSPERTRRCATVRRDSVSTRSSLLVRGGMSPFDAPRGDDGACPLPRHAGFGRHRRGRPPRRSRSPRCESAARHPKHAADFDGRGEWAGVRREGARGHSEEAKRLEKRDDDWWGPGYRCPARTALPFSKSTSINFSLVGIRAATCFVRVSITTPPSG